MDMHEALQQYNATHPVAMSHGSTSRCPIHCLAHCFTCASIHDAEELDEPTKATALSDIACVMCDV